MKYAVLGYNTINIGDDIQSFVASTLVDVSYIVMRDDYEKVYDFSGRRCNLEEPIKLIMNGWFMHNPDWKTGNDQIKFPIHNSLITPVFVSTCLSKDVPNLYSASCLDFYKTFGPVLCRDSATLRKLEAEGVAAEFFGCLTQLLEVESVPVNPAHQKKYSESTIYIDCPKAFRKRRWGQKTFSFQHYSKDLASLNPRERIRRAGDRLSAYRYAKKIYTGRLHAFLPCRAMGLDVEYVGDLNYRVQDLVNVSPQKSRLRERFLERLLVT